MRDESPAPETTQVGDIVAGDYRTAAVFEKACATWSLTYERLQAFEADIHKHVHLENDILFPLAVERFAPVVRAAPPASTPPS